MIWKKLQIKKAAMLSAYNADLANVNKALGVIDKTAQRQTERNASSCPAEAITVAFQNSAESVCPKAKPLLMHFAKE